MLVRQNYPMLLVFMLFTFAATESGDCVAWWSFRETLCDILVLECKKYLQHHFDKTVGIHMLMMLRCSLVLFLFYFLFLPPHRQPIPHSAGYQILHRSLCLLVHFISILLFFNSIHCDEADGSDVIGILLFFGLFWEIKWRIQENWMAL